MSKSYAGFSTVGLAARLIKGLPCYPGAAEWRRSRDMVDGGVLCALVDGDSILIMAAFCTTICSIGAMDFERWRCEFYDV